MTATDVIANPTEHDIQRAEKRPNDPFPLRMFFGHHKCASGWIDNILREFCLHMGLKFKIVHQPYSFEKYGTLGKLVDAERIQFLAYINTTTKYTPDLKVYRGFHVVRDPRDIVVSAYFSHLHSLKAPTWDELNVLRDKLSGLNKEEGLFFELEYLGQQFKEMSEWNYNQEHILEVRMEELSADPLEGFRRILEFMEMYDTTSRSGLSRSAHALRLSMNRLNHKGRRHMPGNLPMFPVPKRPVYTLPQDALEKIADQLSFAKLAGGRTKGQENVNSHYRKGVHGDWKNHYNDEHIAYFKAHYNDLLILLGYEKDGDW
ncbi:MAG: sulfotransferase domain-containing protein [Rhodothermales bacterium]